jgi:hypothetical protein
MTRTSLPKEAGFKGITRSVPHRSAYLEYTRLRGTDVFATRHTDLNLPSVNYETLPVVIRIRSP